MPTLGRTVELADCINSILATKSSEYSLKVLVVDQNEPGFLDDYLPLDDIIFHIHSEIKGLSKNRNIALDLLDGSEDYILFLDDDNILDSDFFRVLNREIRSTPRGFYVVSAMQLEDGRNYTYPLGANYVSFDWRYWKSVISWNMVMSSKLVKDVGKFDERFGVGEYWGACEESDYSLRALRKCKVFYKVSDAKIYHKSRDKNYSNLSRSMSYARGFGAFFRKQQNVDRDKRAYWMAQFLWLLAVNILALIFYFFTPRRKHYKAALIGKLRGYSSYAHSI